MDTNHRTGLSTTQPVERTLSYRITLTPDLKPADNDLCTEEDYASAAQEIEADMDAQWIRMWSEPRLYEDLTRPPSAKARYKREQSLRRYQLRYGQSAYDQIRALRCGQIGHIQGMSIYLSPRIPEPLPCYRVTPTPVRHKPTNKQRNRNRMATASRKRNRRK